MIGVSGLIIVLVKEIKSTLCYFSYMLVGVYQGDHKTFI
jgi:hypothetical protein